MILIPHILTGGAIGRKADKIWLAFVFGWLSHYALDAIPHWEYMKNLAQMFVPANFLQIIIDLILGFLAVWFLTRSFSYSEKLPIFIGAIAAISPDALQSAIYFLKLNWLEPLFVFHKTIHSCRDLTFWQYLPILLLILITSIMIVRGKNSH